MPTVRATTASALAVPWTSDRVTASRTALTGAIARPKPRPAAARTTIDQTPSSDRSPQPVIATKATAASAIPAPATTRGGTTRQSHPPATAPTGAWGAMLVNLLVGVALVAALLLLRDVRRPAPS